MDFKHILLSAGLVLSATAAQATEDRIKGQVADWNNEPVPFATIRVSELDQTIQADQNGRFEIDSLPAGRYTLVVESENFNALSYPVQVKEKGTEYYNIQLRSRSQSLKDVEVIAQKSHTEKLDALTRLPLKPNEQIQSITLISDKVIADQGALTISDAARNASGVYTFSTYGNVRESMSMRGYRGVPILKNGVRINSDFRGTGVLSDMQGIETIQVLKGSSAVTQGIATDIGSPGGVINMITKTPKFRNEGNASLRIGSWGQVRPTFDVQGVLDKASTIAFRVNGAYERANSYRPGISSERIYINPSLEWRPGTKTTLTLEMDHLYDSRTPDPGTINRAANDTNAIYQIPYDYFPGFSSNRSENRGTTYTARMTHKLRDNIYVRAAYFGSTLNTEGVTTSFATGAKGAGNLPLLNANTRYRMLGSSTRDDKNSVLQLDLVGRNVQTGLLKHTFMLGADYRRTTLETGSAAMNKLTYVDVIDFTQPFGHELPAKGMKFTPAGKDASGNPTPEKYEESPIVLTAAAPVASNQNSFGLLAQDVVGITDYVKVILGFRYSSQISKSSATANSYTTGTAFDPQLGLIVSPTTNLNFFGSYTSSTSLSGAANLDTNGNALGNQRIRQLEAGVKSNWLGDKLFVNVTLYKINNRNMSLPLYDAAWNATGFYMKGGNDERKGIEVDITGKPFPNLTVMAGYALIDAQYKEHTSYVEGSAPLNTPRHTANFWTQYTIRKGSLRDLSFGLGAYYIGERPVNDFATAVTHEGIVPGQVPFNIEAYTTVNAQVAYRYRKMGVRVLANNLFNQIGYNAYRTSYINQTDPRNFAVVLSYGF